MTIRQSASAAPVRDDQRLREGYDREAAQYDALRYISSEGKFFSDLEVTILESWLPLGPGKRILDIPTGTGRLTVPLSESGSTLVGSDISYNMLAQGRDKARVQVARHAHFVQGSGTQLPFPDNTFDGVVSFKFFHLVPNERKRAFVEEMTRVLKPGGSIVIEFNSPFYGLFLAALRYYFFKKKPGGMRKKCLFPDQVRWLFEGLRVTRRTGVKLPLAGALAKVLGTPMTQAIDRGFGRIPGLRYFSYAIIIEARKPIR